MHRFFETMKSHPYMIGGLVLGVVIMFYLMSKGSSSSSSGYISLGPSDAAIAANVGLAAVQAQSNSDSNKIAATVQMNSDNNVFNLGMASLLTASKAADTAAQLTIAQQSATIGGQVALGAQSTAVQLATISTTGALAAMDTQAASIHDQNAQAIDLAKFQINANQEQVAWDHGAPVTSSVHYDANGKPVDLKDESTWGNSTFTPQAPPTFMDNFNSLFFPPGYYSAPSGPH